MTDRPRLADLALDRFVEQLASRAPVPGGGSAAALAGAMGAALVGMVVELTVGRAEAEADEAELTRIGAEANRHRATLVELAQRDADAYAAVVEARRLPRDTDEQRAVRTPAIHEATRLAALVPAETAAACATVVDLARDVAVIGHRNAASDAGVAAELAMAALRGAELNVRINLPGLPAGDPLRADLMARLGTLIGAASRARTEALAAVDARIGATQA